MQRKSFGSMSCPIARSLERVGEWWSILILRDAFRGLTRFDQFQKSLDIAPNMLTRRLNALVESGLLERRAYSEHPPRSEYVLTERGRDFRPVLWALLAWGNKHFAPEGASVVVIDTRRASRRTRCWWTDNTGKLMVEPAFRSVPGPAAITARDAGSVGMSAGVMEAGDARCDRSAAVRRARVSWKHWGWRVRRWWWGLALRGSDISGGPWGGSSRAPTMRMWVATSR